MIKIIGAIMIIFGTAAWGFSEVVSLKRRTRSLSAITSSLSIMKSEICDRLTPMPELMEQLSSDSSYPANGFYRQLCKKMYSIGEKPFGEIWREAVSDSGDLMLRPKERQVLRELGLSLGRYNIDEQRGALNYAIRRMEEYTREAERESSVNSKVYAYMGVASGIFAVVVLL